MEAPDLNLLRTLDVLLAEGSVVKAARKLKLSPSAMSRTLARIRAVTGDQLLVRAGRGLVPTARALEMHDSVSKIVEEAQMLLRPQETLEFSQLHRTFTVRASDGFAETFGPALVRKVREEAPCVQLRFIRKLDKESSGLRDGSVDLETGVVSGAIGPEIRAQALFTDHYIGVARSNHPISRDPVTPEVYTSWNHVVTWRQGMELDRIDSSLADLGLKRDIMTTADGFSAALALARGSDLIATVPHLHTAALWKDMYSFPIPLPIHEFTISVLWHPRLDGDPAHQWLRNTLRAACRHRSF